MVFSLEPWSLGDEKAWGYEDYSVQFNVDSGYRKPGPQLHLLGEKKAIWLLWGLSFPPWSLGHGRYPFLGLLDRVH